MRKEHRSFRFFPLSLLILALSGSATPIISNPKALIPDITMSAEQQTRLFALMERQASDRRVIRQTAGQALGRLQKMVIADAFDQSEARQQALIYANALAELTLLDVELALQMRHTLTPEQRQALQDTIDMEVPVR